MKNLNKLKHYSLMNNALVNAQTKEEIQSITIIY